MSMWYDEDEESEEGVENNEDMCSEEMIEIEKESEHEESEHEKVNVKKVNMKKVNMKKVKKKMNVSAETCWVECLMENAWWLYI